jgi:hypothetical protein
VESVSNGCSSSSGFIVGTFVQDESFPRPAFLFFRIKHRAKVNPILLTVRHLHFQVKSNDWLHGTVLSSRCSRNVFSRFISSWHVTLSISIEYVQSLRYSYAAGRSSTSTRFPSSTSGVLFSFGQISQRVRRLASLHSSSSSDLVLRSSLNALLETKRPRKPHIKKPLNAFMIYMKEQRARVIEECTLKESSAINKVLGQKWKELPRAEQDRYYG